MSQPTTEQQLPLPPGPDGLPFLGILPQLAGNALDTFVDIGQRYGPIASLQMGPRTMLLASHPDAVQYILQQNYRNYGKPYDEVRPLIGNGLVSSEGAFWLRQRRLMQPMFHRRRVEGFVEQMAAETAAMLARWEPYARSGEPFDLAAEMMRLTQQIIARTMFSADVGRQTDLLCDAFTTCLEHLNRMLFVPFDFVHRLPTPANRRYQEALETLDDVVVELIERRRALVARDPENAPDDLLTMLLAAQDADSGERMTDTQIRDEVMTIFFAGHETTASALGWAIYLLGRRPDVGARLRDEVETVLEGRTPTMADVRELPLTGRVVDETLRLFPPAWMFARLAREDDEVCGYHIPAGSMVMLSPFVTHRDPTFWEQPYRFEPDRFLPERSQERHRFAYFPFGGGPRLCIGKDFSLVESVIALSMMIQKYRIQLVPGHPVEVRAQATLRPQPAVMVRIDAAAE